MSNTFQGKSKKDSVMNNAELWNPTGTTTEHEGKKYTVRNPNPEPGKEPVRYGYYKGKKTVAPKANSNRQNDSTIHLFQDSEGNDFEIWGSFDLDKQLAAVEKDDGLGTMCQVQWNGYLVKAKFKDAPPEVLKQLSPDHHYHDWTVVAGDHDRYPPIKVEGAETYKPATANVAPSAQPVPPVSQPSVMPTELPTAPVSVVAPTAPQPVAHIPTPAPIPPAAPAPNAPPVSGDFDNEQSGAQKAAPAPGQIPPPY